MRRSRQTTVLLEGDKEVLIPTLVVFTIRRRRSLNTTSIIQSVVHWRLAYAKRETGT